MFRQRLRCHVEFWKREGVRSFRKSNPETVDVGDLQEGSVKDWVICRKSGA